MPSEELAKYTEASLAPGENAADFRWLTDELIRMRSATHPDPVRNENVVARIVCWLVIFKPEEFVETMQKFRLSFRGVANGRFQQERYRASVRPMALLVEQPDQVIFQADLYFNLDDDSGYDPDPDLFPQRPPYRVATQDQVAQAETYQEAT